MGECKKDVTPLLTYWSYVFLALTYQFELQYLSKIDNQKSFILISDYPCSKDTPGHIPELISQGSQSLVLLSWAEKAEKREIANSNTKRSTIK